MLIRNRQHAHAVLRGYMRKPVVLVMAATLFLLRLTLNETRDVRAVQRRKDRRRK